MKNKDASRVSNALQDELTDDSGLCQERKEPDDKEHHLNGGANENHREG